MTRLERAPDYNSVEAEIKDVAGVRVCVAGPRALYRLKRDTLRPIDRQDAAMLRRAFKIQKFRSVQEMAEAPMILWIQ